MALNIDATFEEKLTCAFKNGMRNLANFYCSMFESLKIWTLMGFFYEKQKNDAKFEEELTCQFKIDLRNLRNFDPSTRKSQKSVI